MSASSKLKLSDGHSSLKRILNFEKLSGFWPVVYSRRDHVYVYVHFYVTKSHFMFTPFLFCFLLIMVLLLGGGFVFVVCIAFPR